MPQPIANLTPENPVAQRLADHVLLGRSLREWARQVLLSNGSAYRLWQGSIPDLERLTPAIRIERLSISWLHGGLGPPFLVSVLGDKEAAQRLRRIHASGRETFYVICHGGEGELVFVAYQPTTAIHVSSSRDGQVERSYQYNETEVIVGLGPWLEALQVMREVVAAEGHVSTFDFGHLAWLALATGDMGNTEFFQELRLAAKHNRLHPVRDQSELDYLGQKAVADARGDYVVDEKVVEAFQLLAGLADEDRDAAIHIIKRLHHPRD